tara:strand:+ start:1748 stop:2062 length:315 start_codon:yes stop_codon:yes gene_type:complete
MTNKKKPVVFNEEKVIELIVDIFGLAAMLGSKAHKDDPERRDQLGHLLTIMSSLLMQQLKIDPKELARVTRGRQQMLTELFAMVHDSPENDEDFKNFIKKNPLN